MGNGKYVQNNQARKIKPLPLPVGHKKLAGYKPILSTNAILPNKTTENKKEKKTKKVKKTDVYSTLIDFNTTKYQDVVMSVATSSTRQLPPTPPSLPSEPLGTIWDAQNWSCSYDALFTILWNMWREDHHGVASQDNIMQNPCFHTLVEQFINIEAGYLTLDQARNTVRNKLNAQNAQNFPWGTIGVDMKDLLNAMFKQAPNASLGQETTHCSECSLHNPSSIALTVTYLHSLLMHGEDQTCIICHHHLHMETQNSLHCYILKVCRSQPLVQNVKDT